MQCDMLSLVGTIIGTIVGLIGGAGITWWGAVDLAKRQTTFAKELAVDERKAVAAAKLRAAFAPAQVKLSMPREIGNVEVRKYFDEAFLAHAAAIEEFMPFVSDGNAYQKACDEYRDALFANDFADAKVRWDSGMMSNKHGDNALDFLDVIDKRIKAILNQA